jgi:hypothetical protein
MRDQILGTIVDTTPKALWEMLLEDVPKAYSQAKDPRFTTPESSTHSSRSERLTTAIISLNIRSSAQRRRIRKPIFLRPLLLTDGPMV